MTAFSQLNTLLRVFCLLSALCLAACGESNPGSDTQTGFGADTGTQTGSGGARVRKLVLSRTRM